MIMALMNDAQSRVQDVVDFVKDEERNIPSVVNERMLSVMDTINNAAKESH